MADDWRRKISGCFGDIDLKFAIHALDRERAMDLFRAVAGVDWREVEDALAEFMKRKGCGPEHIEEQLARVREMRSHFN